MFDLLRVVDQRIEPTERDDRQNGRCLLGASVPLWHTKWRTARRDERKSNSDEREEHNFHPEKDAFVYVQRSQVVCGERPDVPIRVNCPYDQQDHSSLDMSCARPDGLATSGVDRQERRIQLDSKVRWCEPRSGVAYSQMQDTVPRRRSTLPLYV